MHKLIFFLTFFIFNKSYSQKKEMEVLDSKDKKPLINVLFYSNNTIFAKSDKNGVVKFKKKSSDTIIIVKEDYYDTIINFEQFKRDTLYLKKIEAIQLSEVIISKKNIERILDSVYLNAVSLKKINSPQYLHFFNVLTTRNDTLLFINNRLNLIRGKGYFIERDNTVISNFILEKNRPVFLSNNHRVVFNNFFNHPQSPSNSFELMIVAKNKEKFSYSLVEENDFYQIKFEPKTKNNDYPYSGYIIVDKNDFGVYEFKAELNLKNNKRNLVLDNEILNFQILNEMSYIKYQKNGNGKYDLVKYAYDSELKVLNGYFKNIIFVNKCRKELTPDFNVPTVLFDLTTYKTK